MLGATAMLGLSALAPRAATAQESDALSLAPPPSGGLFPAPPLNGEGGGVNFDHITPLGTWSNGVFPSFLLPGGVVVTLDGVSTIPVGPNTKVTVDPAKPSVEVIYSKDGTTATVTIDGEGGVSYTFDKTDGQWTYHVQGNNDSVDGKATFTKDKSFVMVEAYADDERLGVKVGVGRTF